MRYPPPGYYKVLVFATRFLIPIRINYSVAASCDEESNPEAPIVIERNVVSLGLITDGYSRDGLSFDCDMRRWWEAEWVYLGYCLERRCSNSGKLRETQSMHSTLIKVGVELDQYARRRKPQSFLPNGHKGIRPNQFILASLVSAATDLGDQAYGESIHACICKYGFEYDNFTNNALLVMYMKLGSVQKGCISYRDLASWNALLSGFDDDVTSHQGPRMFKQMLVEGFKPDMYTLLQHLRNFTCLSDVKFGKQVYAHNVKLRKKDLLAWTAIISAYISSDEVYRAVNCFCQMQKEGLKPNEFALSSCLSGCSDLAIQETRKQFDSLALKLGKARATHVASALVNMCSSACSHIGFVEEGKNLFNSLNKVYGITPTTEHYACMVNILCRAGKFHDVQNFIEEMKLAREANQGRA
ncbi:hypothetical protein RHGRI_013059 [Rhododendron griersonianum]|uniref:Pentatricopeptide repeat-containing protein n=1 Tax=Rhododendron griersonianum TaxID=479676 RepID=A0AAV6K4L0_9ERIC|nr:hypothetical protein RHGRI_013059 [Rhododendron griersonianum]